MRMLKVLILIGAFLFFLYYGNNSIEVSNIKLVLDGLPKGFDEYRILQLSDLHGKVFDRNNNILLSNVRKVKPDLIVITGDFVNYDFTDEEGTVALINEIKKYAPVYYVTGNHEVAAKRFPYLEKKLQQNGINVLRNSDNIIKRNGDYLLITGIDDPGSDGIWDNSYSYSVLDRELMEVYGANKQAYFKILLSHRPEQFPLYAQYGVDLAFSGHAHGGQIRLPFIGGLYAPNQGFFPKYTSGKYSEGGSYMIVSRGLGNGSVPLRIFNRPEIVVVTLYKNIES